MPPSSKRGRRSPHRLFSVTPQLLICLVLLKTDNSQKIARLVVDTGASFTVISHEVASVLGLHPERSMEREEIVTASGVIDAPVLEIPLFAALGVEVRWTFCPTSPLIGISTVKFAPLLPSFGNLSKDEQSLSGGGR